MPFKPRCIPYGSSCRRDKLRYLPDGGGEELSIEEGIDEIADAMNCSHSTIKRRLVKGKKLLEKLLKNKIGGDWFE